MGFSLPVGGGGGDRPDDRGNQSDPSGHLSSGGKKNAPAPPDYKGAATQESQQNAQLNRPDVTTPNASMGWSQGPDGQWHLTTSLNGGLSAANTALTGQAQDALSSPLDFSGVPQLDNGQQARDQAINSAYNQATTRLDPQWNQRGDQLRQQLANQGIDPDSEAGRNAMAQFGRDRNDAYGGAMSSAIAQGTAAGNQVFQNSAMARQMAIADLLRKREQPLAELGQLQSFLQMPNFNQVQGPNLLGAAMAGDNAAFRNYQANQKSQADTLGGFGQLLGLGAQALPFLL
jgi:hypothetical protein